MGGEGLNGGDGLKEGQSDAYMAKWTFASAGTVNLGYSGPSRPVLSLHTWSMGTVD